MNRKIACRVSVLFIPHSYPSSLKCPADRKPETITLAGQKQPRKLFGKSDFRVWVVIINQAERNVDYRNLNAQFQADARTKIAESIKRRFVNAQQRIRLRLAANEKLLNINRRASRADRCLAEKISELLSRQ